MAATKNLDTNTAGREPNAPRPADTHAPSASTARRSADAKATAKSSTSKKAVAKDSTAAAKKGASKATATKTQAAKKAATSSAAPKKAAPKKATPKKETPKSAAAKKEATKKTASAQASAKKAAGEKAAPKKAAAAKKAAAPKKAAPAGKAPAASKETTGRTPKKSVASGGSTAKKSAGKTAAPKQAPAKAKAEKKTAVKKAESRKSAEARKEKAPAAPKASARKSASARKPVVEHDPETDALLEEVTTEEGRKKRKYTRRSKKAPVPVPKYQGKQGLLMKKKSDQAAPVKPRVQKQYGEKDLDYFREIIVQKIHDANEELLSIEERLNDSSSGEYSEDSTYSLHMADQGTDAMEREKAYLFAARERKFISHLTDALQRIKSGNYGICIVCSNLIEKGRLEAVPHARMCVNCKQETKAR